MFQLQDSSAADLRNICGRMPQAPLTSCIRERGWSRSFGALVVLSGFTQGTGGNQQRLLACDMHVITELTEWGTCALQFARFCGWNAAGHKPAVCKVLDRVAQAEDPDTRVWIGGHCTPRNVGLPSFRRFQRNISGSHHTSQACPMFKRLGSCCGATFFVVLREEHA